MINITLIILGNTTQGIGDVPTFILGGCLINCLVYTVFYISMKIAHGEYIPKVLIGLAIISLAFWIPALWLFVQKAKDTTTTPALSRNVNEECMFSMYDKHDMWHFLSGGGLFTLFLILLVMDDGIADVPIKDIAIF